MLSFDWKFLRIFHVLVPQQALGVLGTIDQDKSLNPSDVAAVKELGASV